MEALFALLVLTLAVGIVLAPILAIIAINRTKHLPHLERRLRAAENALDRLYAERSGTEDAQWSPRRYAGAAATETTPEPTARRAAEVFRKEASLEESPSAVEPAPEPELALESEVLEEPVPPTPRPIAASVAPRPAAASPPPSTPARPVVQPPPRPERPRIEWERWVGVRGAAAVGGIVLSLAGLLFFKHAFEQGWITPRTRVITGGVVGLVAIAVSEWLRSRRFRFTPAATAAGGIVVLYASTWASYRLYEFLSALAALPLMAVITAGCAALSIRHRSQLVAILGLVGGFATPLLLSIQQDHPIGLFGYLLLLDLGLLAIGQRMRWPSLGLLGVAGTFLVELFWTARDLDGELLPLALVSLGVFALVFATMGQRAGEEQRGRWFISQAGALLLPFAFAAYFASHVDLGSELWPLSILAATLAGGALWVGRSARAGWLPTGAAAGALAIVATWLVRHGWETTRVWDLALSSAGLGAFFLAIDRWFRRSEGRPEPFTFKRFTWSAPIAPALVATGLAAMLPLAAGVAVPGAPWAWLVGALGLAVLLHFQGAHEGSGVLRAIGAGAAGLTLAIHLPRASMVDAFPGIGVTFGWVVAASALLLALARRSERREERRQWSWSWHASACFLVPVLFALPQGLPFGEGFPPTILGGTLGVALLIALSSVRLGQGRWYAVATPLLLFLHTEWLGRLLRNAEKASIAGELILLELGVVAVTIAFVFVFRRRLSVTAFAWRGAALVPLLAFPLFERLFRAHFDVTDPYWTPLALGGLAVVALAVLAVVRPSSEAVRQVAQRWFGAVCVFLGALLFARVLRHDLLVVTSSLTGLGLAALWRWRDHPVLKLGSVSALVVACGAVLGHCGSSSHYANAPLLVWNWTSYATILPAVSALVAGALLRPLEVARAREWERRVYGSSKAWFATAQGLLGAIALFVWINVQIFLFFEEGAFLVIDFDHFPARDLTMSIVWIAFALAILAIGMARRSSGLRWLSLAFLILTLGKVFLHDLGDLAGLYRVGSLAGLAISLLAVSVLYQRFVFPRERPDEAPDRHGGD